MGIRKGEGQFVSSCSPLCMLTGVSPRRMISSPHRSAYLRSVETERLRGSFAGENEQVVLGRRPERHTQPQPTSTFVQEKISLVLRMFYVVVASFSS